MKTAYEDMIGLSRPVSQRHAPMSMIDRGAQFSPFAALTGYEEAIQETERMTDCRVELDEGEVQALNEKIQKICRSLGARPRITVTYFVNDNRKTGGQYLVKTGRVRKIDPYAGAFLFDDDMEIEFDRITAIESELFSDEE